MVEQKMKFTHQEYNEYMKMLLPNLKNIRFLKDGIELTMDIPDTEFRSILNNRGLNTQMHG